MIKLGEKKFLLADENGDSIPFSAADLQAELVNCFLSAGMRDSSCFAEDVALAVEYALEENILEGNIVGMQELNALVMDTLEKAGFMSAAEWFARRNGRTIEVLFDTGAAGIAEIAAKRGMLFERDSGDEIIRCCENAFRMMNIKECPAGLIVEMLRYYNNMYKEGKTDTGKTVRTPKCDYFIRIADVRQQFPEGLCELIDSGVLKINDVTVYHPSIRIYLDFNVFAQKKELHPVLTEMVWMIYAVELGQSIDAAVEVIQREFSASGGKKELPVYLTVNNMNLFTDRYFGTDSMKDRKLADYLIESLQNNMVNRFYKVRF